MTAPRVVAVSRVVAVWCPDWPVVAAGMDPETPAAVVAAGQVVACTGAARSSGVRRGQRVRDAQRACPELVVHGRDVTAEARLFEQAVRVVESFAPRVEVSRPGLCAVPGRGPTRYFGGEQALADRLHEAVAERGFGCAVGVADGLFAAELAARVGEAGVVVPAGETATFLASHPVTVLDRPELASLLVRLGVSTLGDFAALPVGDVSARFGVDGGVAHRLARGVQPRLLATRAPAEDLSAGIELDPPVEQSEPLTFVAKTLAEELHERLAGHGLACMRVEVQVITTDGRQWSRLWRHDGLLSSSAVAERVRWQLDAWRDPGSPGAGAPGSRASDSGSSGAGSSEALVGGVVSLRLVPDQLVLDEGRQLALWGRRVASDQVMRAAVRIQVMLGHAAVTTPTDAGGRGPGERVLRVPWGDAREPPLPVAGGWPGRVPSPAPAVVPADPLPAVVTDRTGEPVTVSGRSVVSAAPDRLVVDGHAPAAVTGWTGPWPATEHWWDRSKARRLARFQVCTEDGRGWLLAVEGGRWWVEAHYS